MYPVKSGACAGSGLIVRKGGPGEGEEIHPGRSGAAPIGSYVDRFRPAQGSLRAMEEE